MSKKTIIPQYNISKTLKAVGIEFNSVDFFVSAEKSLPESIKPFNPVRSESYAVFICISGTASIRINLTSYQVKQNCIFFIHPGVIFQFLSKSDELKVRVLMFNKDFILRDKADTFLLDSLNMFSVQVIPFHQLTNADTQSLLKHFVLLKEKAEQEHMYRNEIVRNLISAFLYDTEAIYRQYALSFKKGLSKKEVLNIEFQNLLIRNFKNEKQLSFYANQLCVTPRYLTTVVKEVSGNTAGELIDKALILEAQILLKHADLDIAEVAYLLNFSDQAFFSKFFKRHTGLSPSGYRKKL